MSQVASYQLELCVDNLASARAAVVGGADRLELCSALETGGLSPSTAFIEHCCQLGVPVHVLIRYRSGSFTYSADEIELMQTEIIRAKDSGAAGIVIGALTDDHELDHKALATLRQAAADLKVTCHRAFDLVADPLQALNELIELGFDYVLTAGQQASADRGVPMLTDLVQHANQRISVMVGSGLNLQNLRSIALHTGARDFHGTISRPLIHHRAKDYDAIGFSAIQKLSCQDDVARAKAILLELSAQADGDSMSKVAMSNEQ